MIELVPGRSYRRSDIHAYYNGQSQGGISTPREHPVVLLFTGEQGLQYGYEDRFDEETGTFLYTGEGRYGDMEMVRGNRAILEHQKRNRDLHLFQYNKDRSVSYVGRAFYVDHHKARRPDLAGQDREAIVFELELENGEIGEAAAVVISPPPKRTKLPKSFDKLRDAAHTFGKGAGAKAAEGTERKQIVRQRSALIKEYVLRRANGVCEGCDGPAPFKTPKGEWYLEPHHITRRSDGGPDHPRWVIALCPNCHARVHRSSDGASYNQHLDAKALAIEVALTKMYGGDHNLDLIEL